MIGSHTRLQSSLQTILAEEARHRHANEFAAALASLHLLKARRATGDVLVDQTICRLEGNVRLERHLLDCGTSDLHGALLKLCSLISATRTSNPRFQLDIRQRPYLRDPEQMKMLLLMAYELLINATKHSIAAEAPIKLKLDVRASQIVLVVSNRSADGPATTAGAAGNGTRIVQSLAGLLQGRVARRRSRSSMHVLVSIPFLLNSAPGLGGADRGANDI